MAWGTVELESEVAEWLEHLQDDQFGRVEFYIDLLAARRAQLGEPYTMQLQGKLRELRSTWGQQVMRFGSPTTALLGPADHPLDGVPQATETGTSRDNRSGHPGNAEMHPRRSHRGGRR